MPDLVTPSQRQHEELTASLRPVREVHANLDETRGHSKLDETRQSSDDAKAPCPPDNARLVSGLKVFSTGLSPRFCW